MQPVIESLFMIPLVGRELALQKTTNHSSVVGTNVSQRRVGR